MESEGSIPCSPEPHTGTYSVPEQSSEQPEIQILLTFLTLSSNILFGPCTYSIPLRFSN
jgi:hypothetical protein